MVLTATTHSLEIVLDKTVTTQLNYAVYYNDYTSTMVTPVSNYGVTNNTSSVNLITAPSASHQHQLKYCAINNVGTEDVGTKIRFNDTGSYRNLLYVYLKASESIQYTEENGWRVYDLYGGEKINAYHKLPGTIRMPEGFGAPNATTNLSLTNGTSHCVYLGASDRAYSSVRLQYQVTSSALGATIAWAELAIYKGNPTIGSGTTMTRLGFTDTSGVWNTTGNKTTTVNTSNMAINDELWAVFAPSSSNVSPMQLRAGAADNIGTGFFQTVATQPSTNSSISGSINTGSAQIWVAWQGVSQGT